VRDLVELEHARDRALQERAVVRDDHRAARPLGDEPLQPGEAVEVEVVGRLVEQQDVEAREQDRGQRRARGLPTGEPDGLPVEQRGIQPEVAQDRLRPLLQVGAAEREPCLERLGVAVPRAGRVGRQVARGGLHACVGDRDPGAPGEVVLEPLAGRSVGLLRQVAGGPGGQLHVTAVGAIQPGEQAQQRRLPGSVRTDDAEHVAGRDRDRHAGEDSGGAVRLVQVARDQGPGHPMERTTLRRASPWNAPPRTAHPDETAHGPAARVGGRGDAAHGNADVASRTSSERASRSMRRPTTPTTATWSAGWALR
jgi:hypothetical protein